MEESELMNRIEIGNLIADIEIEDDVLPNIKCETHLLLKIKGKEPKEMDNRKSIHTCIVLDSSGSTSGVHFENKSIMESMKNAILKIPQYAKNGDTISIVSFNDSARIECERVDAKNRVELSRAIQYVKPEGRTNFFAGLAAANTLNPDNIVLMTDGWNNYGQDNDDLLDYVEEEETRLNTICFGEKPDTKFGRKLSRKNRGNFRFALTADDVVCALAQSFVPVDLFSAEDVKVVITAAENVSLELISNDLGLLGDSVERTLRMKHIYPFEERHILLKIVVENEIAEHLFELGIASNTGEYKASVRRPRKALKAREIEDNKNMKVVKVLKDLENLRNWATRSGYADPGVSCCATYFCVDKGTIFDATCVETSYCTIIKTDEWKGR